MGARVLTEAERERYDRFPAEFPTADIIAAFSLSATELEVIRRRSGDHNRLGFALGPIVCGLCGEDFEERDLG